jgi:protocatechuate 3,4-dioxygenase beta subunit
LALRYDGLVLVFRDHRRYLPFFIKNSHLLHMLQISNRYTPFKLNKWRKEMNRKNILRLVITISVVALAACAPATIVTSTSNAAVNTVVPTTVSNTDSNSTSTTSPSANNTDVASSLACSPGTTSASVTPELTEGPYYKAGSPEQAGLYQDGMAGTKLIVTGYVYDANCQPVANAWLDFWQADANGNYDNSGYTLRGHQYTDENGRFQLTTVVPGLYPGRTEHIHFKVQAPNGQIITSQLFFPGVAQNDSDGIYNPNLLLSLQETSDGLQGQYNFVVPVS